MSLLVALAEKVYVICSSYNWKIYCNLLDIEVLKSVGKRRVNLGKREELRGWLGVWFYMIL